jgi:glycine dehydrogenase subunit 1
LDFAPHTDDDVRGMLDVLGLPDLDALFDSVPQELRTPPDQLSRLGLADGLSESEVVRHLRGLASQNTTVDDAVCWLGGGAYDHYQPAVVPAITGRSEFSTAYTPYQPEMSQGALQALFEFQTLVSELLGLPVANSSLYDGATALVEGTVLCIGATGRERVVVAGAVDPRYRQVLATYTGGLGVELVHVAAGDDGRVDPDQVARVAGDAAAVIVQHPNVVGVCEDVPGLARVSADASSRLLVSFDASLAGVLEPPGRLGADVVVADGLSLGNGLSFGGPGVGLLACRQADVRRIPGRLVGETVDLEGRRGFVLTLQAREQHIRREKATSNICTNQSLNALATAVYLSWLGPAGLVELGETCLAGASALAERLHGLRGPGGRVELAHPAAPYGKEFALRVADGTDATGLARALADRGHLVGPVLAGWRGGGGPADDDVLLVAVTEQRTAADCDDLVAAVTAVLAEGEA